MVGPSWGDLGAILGALGAILGALVALLGALGRWGTLEALLGGSGGVFCVAPGARLERPWCFWDMVFHVLASLGAFSDLQFFCIYFDGSGADFGQVFG